MAILYHHGQGVVVESPAANQTAMDVTIKKRKFHPLWVIIPAAIAFIVGNAIWIAAYFIGQNSPHTHAREQMQQQKIPNPNLSNLPKY